MYDLSKIETLKTLHEGAIKKEYVPIGKDTMWVIGLQDSIKKEASTLMINRHKKCYLSRLPQPKIWQKREENHAFKHDVIKASFTDCRGKGQYFPYLFRDAVFLPIEGPCGHPDTPWFNLFQVRNCQDRALKKRQSNQAPQSVLTMLDDTEWVVNKSEEALKERMEKAISEYLAFTDALQGFDYTETPLYHAEANFQTHFLKNLYFKVIRKGTKIQTEHLLNSLCERACNGNQTPKWVADQKKAVSKLKKD